MEVSVWIYSISTCPITMMELKHNIRASMYEIIFYRETDLTRHGMGLAQ